MTSFQRQHWLNVTVGAGVKFSGSWLWWLILCVNLTGLRGAQISGPTLFWGSLWGCFGMYLIFKPSRLLSLMWMNLMPSAEGLNRTKRLTFPANKRGVPSAYCLWAETWVLFWIETQTEISAPPGSRASRPSDENLHCWLSWVSSLQILGLVSFCNCFSQFLMAILYYNLLLVLFLGGMLVQWWNTGLITES